MTSPEKVKALEEIEKYIDDGVCITQYCMLDTVLEDDELEKLGSPNLVVEHIWDKYIIWKLSLRDWLWKNNFKSESDIFQEGDGIPLPQSVVQGIRFPDPNSNKSQKFLNKIREQARLKLAILRDVKKRVERIKVEAFLIDKKTLCFDFSKGAFYVYGHKIDVSKSKYQKILLKVIFKNSDKIFDEWDYGTIADEDDPLSMSSGIDVYKRYKNTAEQIKNKIRDKFKKVKDIIIVKSKSVQFLQKK